MTAVSPRLVTAAAAVLRGNDTGVFVKPGPNQYPGQWNWDAAFVVIGLAHLDPPRARDEVRALLAGQWDDGMVPHIVFHQATEDYFPGPDVWGHPVAMPAVATSGITQPPLLATALTRLHELAPDPAFLAEVLGPVEAWHRWFHDHRIGANGLVQLLHPWESGMDNSPRFDPALAAVPPPTEAIERRDRRYVAADQRPADADYEAYLSIVESLRAHAYRPGPSQRTFSVADPFVTAVLARSEAHLADLWAAIGADGSEARRRGHRLERALAGAWDPVSGRFGPDPAATIGGLLPAYALAGHPAVDRLAEALGPDAGFGPSAESPWYPTSVAKDAPTFEPRRYWRGPVWANVNWLVVDTLVRGGHHRGAEHLRDATLELVGTGGFYEYYDPSTGEGLGSGSFSWTAAVVLDFLAEDGRLPRRVRLT